MKRPNKQAKIKFMSKRICNKCKHNRQGVFYFSKDFCTLKKREIVNPFKDVCNKYKDRIS